MTTFLPARPTRQPLRAPRRIVTGLVLGWSVLTVVYAVAAASTQGPVFIDPADADAYSPGPGFVDIAQVLWWLSFLLLPNAMILALMMRRWPRCPSAANRITAVGTILAGAVGAGVVNHLAVDPMPADTAAGLLCVTALAMPAIVWRLLRPTGN